METIVECVPNISEGRDRAIIDEIAAAAGSVAGVMVLDIDPGADTNRTVITFAGPPDAVLDGAFRLFKKASGLIDMSRHTGAHPRIGAVDVCPFVPVSGISMEECAELARRLGRRVWDELKVPVYLYEGAASSPARKSLAAIRKGEYEGLAEKMKLPEWRPDFGDPEFNPKFGAAVIGARPFLIAYNVNLKTPDKKAAHEIAQTIRESGRPRRDAAGAVIKDSSGNTLSEPGRFKNCAAVGWFIESYGFAQVSINLTDYTITGMHHVFDACCEEAAKVGIEVSGSELIGLVPREALLQSGRHYHLQKGGFPAASDTELIAAAVKGLGLSDISPFKPAERIIEEKLTPKRLTALQLTNFIDETASSSVAPGGGSAAALSAGLAAALASMAAALTYLNPKLEHKAASAAAGQKIKAIKEACLQAVDDDAAAFNNVISACRQRKTLPADEAAQRIQAAYQQATAVPLSVARAMNDLLKIAGEIAPLIQSSALSDLAVSLHLAQAAQNGAAWNVRINLPEIKDHSIAGQIKSEIETICKEGAVLFEQGIIKCSSRLNEA